MRVPAGNFERHEHRQHQHSQAADANRGTSDMRGSPLRAGADQQIHDGGEDDGILHAEIGNQNEPAGKGAEDRAHGIGGVRVTYAAADPIQALGK